MVNLVAQCACHQFFPLDDEFIALSVHRLRLHIIGAFHRGRLSGQAQAALLVSLRTARFQNDRVQQLHQTLADINYNGSFQNPYLWCG